LGLEEKYSQFERAALGHTIAKDRIWCLLRDLKLSDIEDSHEAREREINAFRDALSALDEEPHDSVKRACWEEVERELPSDKAWTII
jgi:tRNA A-37 threonylcarbamoyl transferase component Bud32